jgi:hypothetical protein
MKKATFHMIAGLLALGLAFGANSHKPRPAARTQPSARAGQ